MKHLKRIDEAVGTILERRASAEALLKAVVKGDTTEVEGIALSKQMAQGFLDWLQYSTYGKKFGALPFYKLFSAAFNWGLDRYVKGANTEVKGEFKELKAKAKEMSKAERVNEAKSPLNIANAAVLKADVPLSYARDYIDSLERMSKRDKKKFKEYDNFSEEDFIEDIEYNMANENKVNEAKFSFSEDEVKDVAEVIAKALAKMDNMKTAVHDMEYDAGRGAGFEISMGGDKYEGGSYVVKPNGDVVNAAIGNSFPNAVYANIGDTDIKKVMKKIKKFESVTEAEDFKPHMMYDPETGDEYKAEKPEDHERMAKLGYVHEKPESVDEARFVSSYDAKLNDATTREEVLKLYPKAEFFVGKLTHFFGELEPNLFFRANYAGKKNGSFKVKSVYSKKGSKYVHLFNELGESVVNESSGSEERRIALRAIKSIAKYLNRDLRTSAQYLINATEDVQRDIEKGKVK